MVPDGVVIDRGVSQGRRRSGEGGEAERIIGLLMGLFADHTYWTKEINDVLFAFCGGAEEANPLTLESEFTLATSKPINVVGRTKKEKEQHKARH